MISRFFVRHLILATLLLSLWTISASALKVESGGNATSFDLSNECGTINEGLSGALGCDSGSKVLDFTEYNGRLEGPDASGYDPALTRSRTAREFIVTIVNFALSFLGLAAVIVVIYGGLQYVLSRGDDGMVESGKNAMKYAAMGIVIILGSFAFVNTIIGSGGGGNVNSQGAGGSVTGASIAEAGSGFDKISVQKELQSILNDYVVVLNNYNAIHSRWLTMMNADVPFKIDNLVVTDKSIGAGIEKAFDWVLGDEDGDQTPMDVYDPGLMNFYTSELNGMIINVQGTADPFSFTYDESQKLMNFLKAGQKVSWLEKRMGRPASATSTNAIELDGFIQALVNDSESNGAGSCFDLMEGPKFVGFGGSSKMRRDVGAVEGGSWGGGQKKNKEDATSKWGGTSYNGEQVLLDGVDTICENIYAVGQANLHDYAMALNDLNSRIVSITALFDSGLGANTAGNATGSSLVNLSKDAEVLSNIMKQEMAKMPMPWPGGANVMTLSASIDTQTAKKLVKAVDALYSAIQNLEFVSVKLRASTTQGHAPLIVNFDALGTLDPSNETVKDKQILWDLDGDGVFTTEARTEGDRGRAEGSATGLGVVGDQDPGPSNTVIYKKAGTYRARVKVLSSDPNVAPGLAYLNIVVEPPESRIVLKANLPNVEPIDLAGYVRAGEGGVEIPVTKENLRLTTKEAAQDLSFDASESTDRDGTKEGIIYFEWDFGDGIKFSGNRNEAAQVRHVYGKTGTYRASLTVRDTNGVKDSFFFNVIVGSPAARISCDKLVLAVQEKVICDASLSSSDLGSIVGYQWNLASASGTAIPLTSPNAQKLEHVFTSPGMYTMDLTVRDNTSGLPGAGSDTTSTTLVVESRAPIPKLSVDMPEKSQPSLRVFDASASSDPDAGDTLFYEWSFPDLTSEDYDIVEGDLDEARVVLRFLKTGNHIARLKVTDQHALELRKSATLDKSFSIYSILDLDMSVDPEEAQHLEEGEASFDFEVEQSNATLLTIDYGDGQSDVISNPDDTVDFSHNYTKAGVFQVKVTASTDEGDSNSITRRVVVGAADAPIAMIRVSALNQDIEDDGDYVGSTKTSFQFDATESVNKDGKKTNLSYSWNFGDGTVSSLPKVTHTFREINEYTVKLTVRDNLNKDSIAEAEVLVKVEGLDPEIRGVTVVPQGTKLETPLNVKMAVDAIDLDGRITFYKAWYYPESDSSQVLGTMISTQPNFQMTVNTNGEEGEENDFRFVVEVTDNSNNVVRLDEDMEPRLTVVNGPNDSPVATFSVDRTSIYLGESFVFSSSSFDPDGEIVKTWFDVEGNGFFDNEPIAGKTFEWEPTQISRDGYPIQIKVEDNAGATAVSPVLRVYVDANTAPPEAAFTYDVEDRKVSFQNNSTLDPEAELQGLVWDFNMDVDSNGNGVKDDDADSTDSNPSFTYPALGDYRVRLTVVDNSGQRDSVDITVPVKQTQAPVVSFDASLAEAGSMTVRFLNLTTLDEENQASVRSYAWDFDIDADSNGDTDPANDVDSTDKNPTHTYTALGNYRARLRVVDSFGKSGEAVKTIQIASPQGALGLDVQTTPATNADGKITILGDEADISFMFNATGGSGKYRYFVDKNIFFDTSGDGVRDNDQDYQTLTGEAWKSYFHKDYGQILVRVTVEDLETGDKVNKNIQVIFSPYGSANLLAMDGGDWTLFFLFGVASVFLASILISRHRFNP